MIIFFVIFSDFVLIQCIHFYFKSFFLVFYRSHALELGTEEKGFRDLSLT